MEAKQPCWLFLQIALCGWKLTVSAMNANIQMRILSPKALGLLHNLVDSLLCWKDFGYQLQGAIHSLTLLLASFHNSSKELSFAFACFQKG